MFAESAFFALESISSFLGFGSFFCFLGAATAPCALAFPFAFVLPLATAFGTGDDGDDGAKGS